MFKERVDSPPALDAIGLELGDSSNFAAGPHGGDRRLNSLGMGDDTPLQRQSSVGLGLGPVVANMSGLAMGNFQSPSTAQSQFDASNAARDVSMPFAGGVAIPLTPKDQSESQGGVGEGGADKAKRECGGNALAGEYQTTSSQTVPSSPPLRQIKDIRATETQVKSLLNHLSTRNFDLVSDQIIEWANKSEQEKDGSTLLQVTKLVFEKAKEGESFGEVCARLCRKMVERVSPNIQDETIRNSEGRPITGGMLFRKYLLNRCQEDFERGWSAKETTLAAVAAKASKDKVPEVASEGNGEEVLYSEERYAAAKARRQGLGLIRFIGELFKQQMLTERIMHECIKKLLVNTVNPEEEEIESLCKLLTTAGKSLDNPKARNHLDIYFERMQDMANSSNINSRMQHLLLDVIELRARRWQPLGAAPRPSPTHQGSSRDGGRYGVPGGGFRRGEARGANVTEPDGWNVASGAGSTRPAARAGDLSQFGKISNPTGIQFGPSSVFRRKDANKRDSSIGRASGADMFSALSRKTSVDLEPSGSPTTAGTGGRRKLKLLPRVNPAETEADGVENKDGGEGKAPTALTEAEAQTKVKEDVKKYLSVQNVERAIMALESLPSEHRHLFVDKLTDAAMNNGNKVVVLAEKLFAAAHSRSLISPDSFERGLLPTIEVADDLSIDVPKMYEWLARMIHAAGLGKTKTEEMAGKILVCGEPRVTPSELLMKEFEKVSLV